MTKHNSLTRLQLFAAFRVYLLLRGMERKELTTISFLFISVEGSKIENLFRIWRGGARRGSCDNRERKTMRESWKIKKFVFFATLFLCYLIL